MRSSRIRLDAGGELCSRWGEHRFGGWIMYVGRRYTATVVGSVWKTICCEFCGLEWAYQLTRRAQGTGRSPYFLDNDGARQRASEEANNTLQRQLATEED